MAPTPRCDEPGSPPVGGRALALVNDDRMLWVLRLDEISVRPGGWSCPWPPTSHVTLVNVIPDPRRELLVQIRDCVGSGELGDADQVFSWRDGSMVAVAEAVLDCQYTGNTGDPDAPEPPAEERYACEGSYLDVGDDGVAIVSVPSDTMLSGDRDSEGRVRLGARTTRRALRWDPATSRFIE